MPDISMCWGTDCISRRDCYRFRAVPNPNWQSYFIQDDSFGETGPNCEHFIPRDDRRVRSFPECEKARENRPIVADWEDE